MYLLFVPGCGLFVWQSAPKSDDETGRSYDADTAATVDGELFVRAQKRKIVINQQQTGL